MLLKLTTKEEEDEFLEPAVSGDTALRENLQRPPKLPQRM